jgi:hypothetical protein
MGLYEMLEIDAKFIQQKFNQIIRSNFPSNLSHSPLCTFHSFLSKEHHQFIGPIVVIVAILLFTFLAQHLAFAIQIDVHL